MQVVIAGAGIAGSAAALALARQGHRVQLLDRDDSPRPPDLARAAEWERRGVAQFSQPHALLARLHAELTAGLPDVVAALEAAGARPVSLPDGLTSLWCRRSTLEWVLRAAVEAEPGVDLRHADVRAVLAGRGVVTGVRLADGAVLPADLVVDATGRRGRLSRPWLRERIDVPADEVYTSRRYRLLPGAAFGTADRGVIGAAEADGYALLVFPHDAGTFSVCFTRLPDDPELAALREPAAFAAAARLVPLAAEWTDPERAEPISPVLVMGGLRSTSAVLADDAPLGLHPLADAVSTTNPHFGRGLALAVAHALRLADAVAAAPGDARSWRAQVDAWVGGELRDWFDDGRATDAARARAWRAVREGTGRPARLVAGSGEALSPLLVLAAAGADPAVGRAVARHMHMVDPPAALRAVHPRVAALLAQGWLPGRPPPTRRPDGVVTREDAAALLGADRPAPGQAPAPAPAPPRRRLVEVLAELPAGQA